MVAIIRLCAHFSKFLLSDLFDTAYNVLAYLVRTIMLSPILHAFVTNADCLIHTSKAFTVTNVLQLFQ